MSVIEYLLEQQAVVISLAAIGGLIGLAILLLVGTFTVRLVRGYLAAQQQKRIAKQEQALAKRRQQEMAEKRARQKRQAARQPTAPTPDIKPAAPVLTVAQPPPPITAPPVVTLVSAVPNPEPATTEESQETDPEIQSILDSVFVDDEANARYENLMRGVEVPSMDALAELAASVARRLDARYSPSA
jgi:hypothetical protein